MWGAELCSILNVMFKNNGICTGAAVRGLSVVTTVITAESGTTSVGGRVRRGKGVEESGEKLLWEKSKRAEGVEETR